MGLSMPNFTTAAGSGMKAPCAPQYPGPCSGQLDGQVGYDFNKHVGVFISFQNVTNSAQLNAVFQQIAASIAALHLSK